MFFSDKNVSVKNYHVSPTHTKSLINSYFNTFLTLKPSSIRAQKIDTDQ